MRCGEQFPHLLLRNFCFETKSVSSRRQAAWRRLRLSIVALAQPGCVPKYAHKPNR
jgi:hypothetical protein